MTQVTWNRISLSTDEGVKFKDAAFVLRLISKLWSPIVNILYSVFQEHVKRLVKYAV